MDKELQFAIINRLLNDPDFNTKYFSDREGTLAEAGVTGTTARWFLRAIKEPEDVLKEAKRLDETTKSDGSNQIIFPSKENTSADDSTSSKQVVSNGFASKPTPAEALNPNTPLAPDTDYYYWFQIGAYEVAGNIDSTITTLDVDIFPPEAVLKVVLFAFEDGLQVSEEADIGELIITEKREVQVHKRVATPDVGEELLYCRLFFPVKTSTKLGTQQLRCNLYYKQNLIQSRLITAQVADNPHPQEEPALKADALDYTLSKSFNGKQLDAMGSNKMSIMLNDNGNGTHGFRFFGEDDFKNDASFDGHELAQHIETARRALRNSAWGNQEPYKAGNIYKYADDKIDEARLHKDLQLMAVYGKRFHKALIVRLAGNRRNSIALKEKMLTPGQVQFAMKENARAIVPLAMFYDYPLDDGADPNTYTLCETFKDALTFGDNLEETDCFQGNCPHYDDDLVVCPSGFWGFRHNIGLPVSVKEAEEAPLEIPSPEKPEMAVSVSTDRNFRMRPKHIRNLKKMFAFEDGGEATSRDDALDLMKKSDVQVVYFYCHGGFDKKNSFPYLSVGDPKGDWLTTTNIFDKEIFWTKTRPLVFINGCHTTALTPEVAIDFVNTFVVDTNAAAVVGTEITIFEPIATSFGEEFMDRFLNKKESFGEAIRRSRLSMLAKGNPLGLVYIPYGLPALKIVPA